MMAKGVTMNNKVAEAAGATEKIVQGNQVINTGKTPWRLGPSCSCKAKPLF